MKVKKKSANFNPIVKIKLSNYNPANHNEYHKSFMLPLIKDRLQKIQK